MKENVRNCAQLIQSKCGITPKVALVLGSGLGHFDTHIENAVEIPYASLPGFPVSTVPGHAGKYVFGTVHGLPVVCMSGRVHTYEGYSSEEAVMPLRVMHALGADTVLLTNASGGMNPDYKVGDLVMLTDQISCFIRNPLIGKNDDEEGPRFFDMTSVYDEGLRSLLQKSAEEEDVDLKKGVYVQLSGPSFETPAEIRMLHALGADLVGMSTVVEAIAARHMDMRVMGISLVTNLAAGISPVPLSHEEVKEAGAAAEPVFTRLVLRILQNLKNEV